MAHRELLISWLNDAYAMENGILRILENHVNDARDHPQMQAKLREHLETTRRHADMVKREVERLGGDVSAAKTVIGNVIGAMQAISTGPTEDELVKNSIADYAVEHFEIASYKALIAAAQQLGDQELVRTCQAILRDEEDMARWLDQQLPMAVTEIYQRKAAEHRAA